VRAPGDIESHCDPSGGTRPWWVTIGGRTLLDRVGRTRRFRSEQSALAFARELAAVAS
jgi:hypothetical protein